jgi:hypothetical protein
MTAMQGPIPAERLRRTLTNVRHMPDAAVVDPTPK